VPGEGEVPDRLREIVTAAVLRHGRYGYGNPVMLVHSATAPLAVLRTLPALPADLAGPSLEAAWAVAAAVTAAYAPAEPRPVTTTASDPAEVIDRAATSGDPHAIKFADAAAEMWHHTPDPSLLAAANQATDLIG
jgi:hypothetical protein